MPVALRGYFLSYINLWWILGQTWGITVIRALVVTQSEWAYHVPFALQWAFIAVILTGVVFAPDSPWWLIRQEWPEDARKSLLRLTRSGAGALSVDEIVAMMKHTNEVQKHLGNGNMTYVNCFRRRSSAWQITVGDDTGWNII
ncbi:general substrate transporter [Aspergillus cavernicola]|uniref:General substrate transporter n=1 Tax=Aspergillus cavernicola TaxID=176166 RepID=A0ABR4IJR2_9EURO